MCIATQEYTPPLNDAGFSITIFPPIPIMAPESNDERDERVARLWETLDTRKEGHVDLSGLKKGLKKIDHRESDQVPCRLLPTDAAAALKNADDLLRSILVEVDTNHDGQIDYAGKIRSYLGPVGTPLVSPPADGFLQSSERLSTKPSPGCGRCSRASIVITTEKSTKLSCGPPFHNPGSRCRMRSWTSFSPRSIKTMTE